MAGRRLDDDANILLRLENGAKGALVCSQIACGEENDLNIRIYGTQAGLEWHQSGQILAEGFDDAIQAWMARVSCPAFANA